MESDIPLTLKEILVDGKAYPGDPGSFDLYNGFFIGPVNYDSTVKVVTEALDMEFEQEMELSTDNSYCYINYISLVLPEEVHQKAIDIAAAILPDWLRAVYSYDRDALKNLESSGSLFPDFLDDLDRKVSQAWNSAEEVFYIQYDQIDVQKSEAYAYSVIDPVCYIQVEMPALIRSTEGFMSLATGVFEKDEYGPDYQREGFGVVSLIYQDGKWVVDALGWYWY